MGDIIWTPVSRRMQILLGGISPLSRRLYISLINHSILRIYIYNINHASYMPTADSKYQ